MSLRWRLLTAFILIILLAVSLSVGVGFYTTQRQLDRFVEELSRVEANNLAQNLSRAYTQSAGWETVETALADAGYLYSSENEGTEHGEGGEQTGESAEESGSELFHLDRIRIVIVDVNDVVINDNFAELTVGSTAPVLSGRRAAIVDLNIQQTVGYAYVDVNSEFLATESLGFLRELLTSSAAGGLVITVAALLLAAWLARRITAPVTALTQATQEIAKHGDPALLPVNSSDELGQMSAAFNQMSAALQTQRDLRKRLINDVSHELNTPLSVIQLEAHGLRKGLQTPDRAAEQIIQEVNMLHNLVSDLNWLAESESEALRLSLDPCAVEQLLRGEVERWQPQAQNRQVLLTLEPLPEVPTLDLDQMRMRQALGNVINNALQHTEAGGVVTVGCAVSREPYAEDRKEGETAVSTPHNTPHPLRITIADNGAGIDPAELPHIFNRFYRTDQSRTRRTGGMGLGLAIARTIIEAHGGTIAVTSEGVGLGTAVTFTLPISPNTQ